MNHPLRLGTVKAGVPATAGNGMRPASPAGAVPALNPMGILLALRRRWMLAVVVGVLTAASAGAVAWFVIPVTYTARSTLKVDAIIPKILFDTPEGRTDFGNYQRSQLALIKSRPVLNIALRDPKVAGIAMVREKVDPVEWLEKEIQADFSVAPEILRVSLSGKDREDVTAIVNAVVEAYLKEIVDHEHKQRQARLDSLEKIYSRYEDVLRSKRRSMRDMADNVGSKDSATLALKNQFALANLNKVQSELLDVQSELRHEEMTLAAQKEGSSAARPPVISEATLDEAGDKDRQTQEYLARIEQLKVTIDGIKQRAVNPGNLPTYTTSLKALDAAQKGLTSRREKLRSELLEKVRERTQNSAALSTGQRQEKIEQLKKLEGFLTKEVERRTTEVNGMQRTTVDMEWLKDEIAQVEDVQKRVGAQVQALQVEIGAPARVRIFEEAAASRAQDEKRPLKMAGMAAAGAFGLVLLAVGWWEFQTQKVSSVDEVVNGLGVQLFGTLPILPERVRGQLPESPTRRDLQWHNLLIESVDATRTMLMHTARLESLRCVMVTSALGGEGKTMLSSHLAASLARAGFRTLLVDCDLRSPSLNHLLELPLAPGFCDLLRNETTFAEAVRTGPIDGFWVLPAGQCDGQAIAALAQGGAGPIFQQLKEHYDFLVIDSAPVLPVADSLLIGQHVDGVVLSVLRDVSRLPSINTAYERLTQLGIRVLGVVVNGVRGGLYGSSYQYATTPPAAKL